VDPFVRGTDYFSTYGGSTAACAAALAVLRTIEEERLVDHAALVGAHLLEALRDVADAHPVLSAPRGWGLTLAVDVVDPATGQPDAGRAARVVEGMRDRGVLIGRTGRDRAALKIRPPLVFADRHVTELTEALGATCAGLA
jgi:4-aminobutyrate aminotransferase-like enzyme